MASCNLCIEEKLIASIVFENTGRKIKFSQTMFNPENFNPEKAVFCEGRKLQSRIKMLKVNHEYHELVILACNISDELGRKNG